MNNKLKRLIGISLAIIGVLVLVVVGYIAYGIAFRTHPDPVAVYFNGQKMGTINKYKSKTFYRNEVLTTASTDLLVELKSGSGEILYSRSFTWEELIDTIRHGILWLPGIRA
jgi:lipopolysaccharide/colanic/teichoic acid biosynthesis glycosyltransferase